jgi:hypothetical protein
LKLDFAFFADFALAHPDGKLYVLGGGIDRVLANQFPAQSRMIALVARVQFSARELGQDHIFGLSARDQDGRDLVPQLKSVITPQRPPNDPSAPTVAVHIVLTMNNIVFREPGDLLFVISVDSRDVGTVSLRVRQASPDATESTPLAGSPTRHRSERRRKRPRR